MALQDFITYGNIDSSLIAANLHISFLHLVESGHTQVSNSSPVVGSMPLLFNSESSNWVVDDTFVDAVVVVVAAAFAVDNVLLLPASVGVF